VAAGSWTPTIVEVIGRFTAASNATLLARTDDAADVVYKPVAGEQPLWDFPSESLAHREVLTYEVDRALGFGVVPETVYGDGPYGPGSIQRFVDHDPDFDALTLVRSADPSLWPIAALDVVCNNADRKLGHVLGNGSHLWAIDHGLTFHPEDKLRTVMWMFAGEEYPLEVVAAFGRLEAALEGQLGDRVRRMLGRRELAVLRRRLQAAIAARRHPAPPEDRPAVPWPPY
jgi:hypothetical protein